jgi:pimeloyl-ACP methyl ester carboxylesterase
MCTDEHTMCMLVHMSDFSLPTDQAAIDDLHSRLSAWRRPILPETGSQRGVSLADLETLLQGWREFDWRAHEERILGLPWTTAGSLNVVHQPVADSDAQTVVLLHGWPDSVLRFERVLPLLDDVNVVIPALPGFPFAAPLTETGMSALTMANLVDDAVRALGYDHYVVSAGDVGGDVAEQLAALHPDRVAALHLTNVSPLHAVFADRSVLTEEELAYLDVVARWSRAEGGYIAEQASKPHTLAMGLADSPAGLAAWLLEKLQSWTEVTPRQEDLLTWISAYWFTNTIGSSFATYVEFAKPIDYVTTPTVLSAFAHDTKPAPRAFAERFVNVQDFRPHEHGGHFAAFEEPEDYVEDLRAALALAH